MRNRKILKTYLYLIAVVLLLGIQSAAVYSDDWPQPLGPIESREQFIKEHFQGRSLARVEGIWINDEEEYEIAIVKNNTEIEKEYNFLGVVISSKDRNDKLGDLKVKLRGMSNSTLFTGMLYEHNHYIYNIKLLQRDYNSIIVHYKSYNPDILIRMYPDENANTSEVVRGSGSGFFIASDLILTNWHVVEGCSDIKITLSTGKEAKAEVAVKDTVNDLALLRVKGLENPPSPLVLGVPRTVKAGDKAYTIGFPLPDEMGVQAKVSEGIINSTSGMEDDPRMFQISIPVQPGNSGGPLLDSKGEVVGVVTAGLNNIYLLVKKETLSQNVNYAMKINYLDTLLGMLPEAPKLAEIKNTEEMEASQIMEKLRPGVVLVTAKGGEDKKEEPEEK